jgi:hypothetical protein
MVLMVGTPLEADCQIAFSVVLIANPFTNNTYQHKGAHNAQGLKEEH